MNVMLLAAGRGERMLPLTRSCPKPLLPVAGVPLLERWLQKLEAIHEQHACIDQIVINAAYLGEQIETFIAQRTNRIPVLVSREEVPLETAGGIMKALPHLGGNSFLLINGDVFCDADLAPWLTGERVLTEGDLGHLLFVNNPEHNEKGDFSLDGQGRVTPYQIGSSYTFSGVSLLSPNIMKQYPNIRNCFPLREVFDWAIAKQRLTAEHYSGFWVDVGTPQRLLDLERHLNLNAT